MVAVVVVVVVVVVVRCDRNSYLVHEKVVWSVSVVVSGPWLELSCRCRFDVVHMGHASGSVGHASISVLECLEKQHSSTELFPRLFVTLPGSKEGKSSRS